MHSNEFHQFSMQKYYNRKYTDLRIMYTTSKSIWEGNERQDTK